MQVVYTYCALVSFKLDSDGLSCDQRLVACIDAPSANQRLEDEDDLKVNDQLIKVGIGQINITVVESLQFFPKVIGVIGARVGKGQSLGSGVKLVKDRVGSVPKDMTGKGPKMLLLFNLQCGDFSVGSFRHIDGVFEPAIRYKKRKILTNLSSVSA